MTILLHPWLTEEGWLEALAPHLPNESILLCSDDDAAAFAEGKGPLASVADDIELVVAWRHPAAALSRYRNLQAILCTGAGVNQFVGDGFPDVPIVRLADPTMAQEMAAYAVHWVVRYQRGFDVTSGQQTQQSWTAPPHGLAADFTVGILGYGEIGSTIGRAFQTLGYGVSAWSRSGGNDPGVTHYAGLDQLTDFLHGADAIVNVLPSTDATANLMDAERFAACKPEAIFVNVGRGATVNERDLIAALDAGQIRRAVLDVTAKEPLPEASPLWSHAKVDITPHIAGTTQKVTAARVIAANIHRLRRGEQPFPMFQPSQGY